MALFMKDLQYRTSHATLPPVLTRTVQHSDSKLYNDCGDWQWRSNVMGEQSLKYVLLYSAASLWPSDCTGLPNTLSRQIDVLTRRRGKKRDTVTAIILAEENVSTNNTQVPTILMKIGQYISWKQMLKEKDMLLKQNHQHQFYLFC